MRVGGGERKISEREEGERRVERRERKMSERKKGRKMRERLGKER